MFLLMFAFQLVEALFAQQNREGEGKKKRKKKKKIASCAADKPNGLPHWDSRHGKAVGHAMHMHVHRMRL